MSSKIVLTEKALSLIILMNMFQKRYNLIAIILIIIVSTGVYINTFKNEFVYDDIKLIVENPEIRNLSNISHLKLAERPMRTISLMLDYKLFKLNPAGYHLTNLILHILCSILVYFFIAGLTSHFPLPTSHFPLLTSLLFAVHPIQTEAVACISNRKEMLCMLFFMLSIILYIKTRDQRHKTKDLHLTTHIRLRRTQLTTLFYYLGSIISFILALLSKQVAIALPVMIIFYDLYYGKLTKKRIWYYIPYCVILVTGILFAGREISALYTPQSLGGLPYSSIILTMFKAFARYLRVLTLPYNLCVEYYIPFSKSIFDVKVILSLMTMGFLIWLIVRTYKYSKIISFGLLWLFINYLTISNIVPGNYIYAEHYLYIPSLGFCCLVAWLLSRLVAKKRALWIITLMVILIYAALTIKRNSEWKSEYTLWSTTVARCPISAVGHYNLGLSYKKSKNFDKAAIEFKRAAHLRPNYFHAHNNLGLVLIEKGLYEKAIAQFKRAIEIGPDSTQPYNNLGLLYCKQKLFDKASFYYEKALKIKPDSPEILYNLGTLYTYNQNYEKAISSFLKTIEVDSNFVRAYNNLGNIYLKFEKHDDAIAIYKKAIKIDPNYALAYYNLAAVYKKVGLIELAKQAYQKFLRLRKKKVEK